MLNTKPYQQTFKLTHISLILECVIAVVTATVKVRRLLPEKGTRLKKAILGGSKSLKTLLNDGRVLAVVVGMHLHI